MKPRFEQTPPRQQPKPVYPRQEPEMEWLRPVLWFGIIGIIILLVVVANLPQ